MAPVPAESAVPDLRLQLNIEERELELLIQYSMAPAVLAVDELTESHDLLMAENGPTSLQFNLTTVSRGSGVFIALGR